MSTTTSAGEAESKPSIPSLSPFVMVGPTSRHEVTLQIQTDIATATEVDYDLNTWPRLASDAPAVSHSFTLDHLLSGENHDYTLTVTDPVTMTTVDVTGTVGTLAYNDDGLPSGWTHADIGPVGLAGGAIYDANALAGGAWVVRGTGTNVFFDEDSFHFVHHAVSGDFTLTLEVESYGGYLHMWTKAMTMFRVNLADDAAFFNQSLNFSGYDYLYYRPSAGAQHVLILDSQLQPAPGVPTWLRLQRIGDTFIESYSPDGINWTPHGPSGGTTVPLPASGLVGFGVCSKSNAYLSEIVYSNVTLTAP